MSYKYLSDGQQVYVNKKVDGGAIVTALYESYDDHERSVEVEGNPMYYDDSQLFDKPPVKLLQDEVAKIHAEIAVLNQRAKSAKAEGDNIREENNRLLIQAAGIMTEHKHALETLPMKHAQLQNLRLFFEGGIRYVVEVSSQDYWQPRLIDATDKDSSTQNYSNSLALLTLHGSLKSKDPLAARWTIDRNPGDRYGSGNEATLHATLEDACVTFDAAMKRYARSCRGKVDQAYMNALNVVGIEPDEYAVKQFEQTKQAEAKAKRDKAEAAIAAAQKELENIES